VRPHRGTSGRTSDTPIPGVVTIDMLQTDSDRTTAWASVRECPLNTHALVDRDAGRRKTVPMRAETRYALSGDVSIAYQVFGEGSFDVVLVPGSVSHVELSWTVPSIVAGHRRWASVARVIIFDKRGTGMSDRVSGAPTLEARMDDVRAVMDAAGSQRAAIVGVSEGAPMSLLFAATYPERAAALVLWGGFARTMWAPDYPWGSSEEDYRKELEDDQRLYGSPAEAEQMLRARGLSSDDARVIAEYFRQSASPGARQALGLMNKDIDVRQVLPAIRVPTLLVHGADDTLVPIGGAHYMAERIPGARLLEVPGAGHLAVGDVALRLIDEIGRFLSDVWDAGAWEAPEPDRVLATVLFTDIVRSSEKAASLGDRGWRELLERHHQLVRRNLVRFRGREVDTAGDGFFASFDGPARAIRCACAIVESMPELDLHVRAGLHTGECELIDGKVAGIAVHTGARVASYAEPGEVLVSSTVKELVAGSGLEFTDRGLHELKGIPGEWRLYAVAY
jgi:pimeloyl-ACP methyl ester carboxylesterase